MKTQATKMFFLGDYAESTVIGYLHPRKKAAHALIHEKGSGNRVSIPMVDIQSILKEAKKRKLVKA